jgi:hypothetical protein
MFCATSLVADDLREPTPDIARRAFSCAAGKRALCSRLFDPLCSFRG